MKKAAAAATTIQLKKWQNKSENDFKDDHNSSICNVLFVLSFEQWLGCIIWAAHMAENVANNF